MHFGPGPGPDPGPDHPIALLPAELITISKQL